MTDLAALQDAAEALATAARAADEGDTATACFEMMRAGIAADTAYGADTADAGHFGALLGTVIATLTVEGQIL